MGYIGRHWRGELSLPVAFWVNNFLLWFPVGLGLGLLMTWVSGWGQNLQALSITGLGVLVLLIVLSIWAPVGAWRSASRYLDDGGSTLWGLAAKFVLGLGLVGNVLSIGVQDLSELPTQLRLASGQDPIGRLDIALAPDGRSVTLSGPFSMGAASRFERSLAAAPQLRRVVLDSPGGRLYEAHEIATLVRARGLQTRASGDCASACTLVFVAGAQRSVATSAHLGFHRASVPSLNPLHDQLANRKLAALYEEAGLPNEFVARVLRVPSSRIWVPELDELVSAGILTQPTLRPDLDSSLPADAPLERYHEALNDNALWVELDRRLPGAMDAAATRMLQARLRGLALDAVALEAQAQALTAVPTVLRTAGSNSQESFLALLAAELRERQGAGDVACQAALSSVAGRAAQEGAAPAAHIASWLQTALLEPAVPQEFRALSALEFEVLRRDLGATAPESIAVIVNGAPTRKHSGVCAKTIELLDSMTRLRGPQRRLAVRLMLQAPA